MTRRFFSILAALALMAAGASSLAQKKYDTGVSDTEIRLGQTMPYSGPLSSYGVEGRVQVAYFKMLNEKGGINGRKVNLISLDDGYSPPRSVEQTRKLVESENVLAIVSSMGTAHNTAVQKYLNGKKVPQLLALTGYSKMVDPEKAPWTTSFMPSYNAEGKIYARYLLDNRPEAKVAMLSQNDELGRDFVRGFLEGLGDKAKAMIVKEATYDATDTTVDSQILTLKGAGADTFVLVAIGKFPAQAIRKSHDIGWKPTTLLFNAGNSIKTSLEPAGGLERSVGMLSSVWLKTPGEAQWASDKGMQSYLAFMRKYVPEVAADDLLPALGYTTAQVAALVLAQCGDDLSRENVIRQANAIKNGSVDLLLPGMTLNTSPTLRNPTSQLQMARFDGKTWVPFGPVIDSNDSGR